MHSGSCGAQHQAPLKRVLKQSPQLLGNAGQSEDYRATLWIKTNIVQKIFEGKRLGNCIDGWRRRKHWVFQNSKWRQLGLQCEMCYLVEVLHAVLEVIVGCSSLQQNKQSLATFQRSVCVVCVCLPGQGGKWVFLLLSTENYKKGSGCCYTKACEGPKHWLQVRRCIMPWLGCWEYTDQPYVLLSAQQHERSGGLLLVKSLPCNTRYCFSLWVDTSFFLHSKSPPKMSYAHIRRWENAAPQILSKSVTF